MREVIEAASLYPSIKRLGSQDQSRTALAILDFRYDESAEERLRYHKLQSNDFWSFSATKGAGGVRVLVLPTPGGGRVLVHADYHDDAYKWADRRRGEVDASGAVRVVEVVEGVETSDLTPSGAGPRLFQNISDADILSCGVPLSLLGEIRGATEESLHLVTAGLPDATIDALLSRITDGNPDSEMWTRRVLSRLLRNRPSSPTIPPFGFKVDSGLVVPDEHEQRIIRLIVEMYESMSTTKIASHLNKIGITTKKGCAWHPSQVATVLRRALRGEQVSAVGNRKFKFDVNLAKRLYEDGLTYREVASRLGTTVSEVKRAIRAATIPAESRPTGLRGATVKYGFKVKSGALVRDDSDHELATRVHSMRQSGSTIQEIIDILNAEGVKTKRGKPWRFANMASFIQRTRILVVTEE